jgi:hypothetical protein
MKRISLCSLLLLCACTKLLDEEALERAIRQDKTAAAQLGADAKPMLSAEPGDRHYIQRGNLQSRQVHLYSRVRDSTTVVDGRELRRNATILIIGSYTGGPPPTDRWVREQSGPP